MARKGEKDESGPDERDAALSQIVDERVEANRVAGAEQERQEEAEQAAQDDLDDFGRQVQSVVSRVATLRKSIVGDIYRLNAQAEEFVSLRMEFRRLSRQATNEGRPLGVEAPPLWGQGEQDEERQLAANGFNKTRRFLEQLVRS